MFNTQPRKTLAQPAKTSVPLEHGVSVVVPVYNSEETLFLLAERVNKALQGMAFELIFVNDGSRGRSWECITRLSEAHNWIFGINLMRNVGQHNALLCGIRAARYDTIATIDDDLQNPPEEIIRLLEQLNQGYDVVYGTPEHQQHGIWRDLASLLTKRILQGIMGAATAKYASAFRVFRTQLRDAFANYQSSFVAIDVLLTWGTTHFSAIVVKHEPRTIGVSNYTFRKLLTHALNLMTGFTTWPLQLASLLGFVFTGFGMLVFAYVIGRYFIEGGSVPGFPFLASIIALFSGVQLFALGIIGEYLARMHFRSMERPTYTVRETTDRLDQVADLHEDNNHDDRL